MRLRPLSIIAIIGAISAYGVPAALPQSPPPAIRGQGTSAPPPVTAPPPQTVQPEQPDANSSQPSPDSANSDIPPPSGLLTNCRAFARSSDRSPAPATWVSQFSGSDLAHINPDPLGVEECKDADEVTLPTDADIQRLASHLNTVASDPNTRIIVVPTLPNSSSSSVAAVAQIRATILRATQAGKIVVTGSNCGAATPGVFCVGAASFYGMPSGETKPNANALFMAGDTESEAVRSFADLVAQLLDEKPRLQRKLAFGDLDRLLRSTALQRGVGPRVLEVNPLLATQSLANTPDVCLERACTPMEFPGSSVAERNSCSSPAFSRSNCFTAGRQNTRIPAFPAEPTAQELIEQYGDFCTGALDYYQRARTAYFLTGGAPNVGIQMQHFFTTNGSPGWAEVQSFTPMLQDPPIGAAEAQARTAEAKLQAMAAQIYTTGPSNGAAANTAVLKVKLAVKQLPPATFLNLCSPYFYSSVDAVLMKKSSDEESKPSAAPDPLLSPGYRETCAGFIAANPSVYDNHATPEFRAQLASLLIQRNRVIMDPTLADQLAQDHPVAPDSQAYHDYRKILNLTARGWALRASLRPPQFTTDSAHDFQILMNHVEDISIAARGAMLDAFKGALEAEPNANGAANSSGANSQPHFPEDWLDYFGTEANLKQSLLFLASFGTEEDEKPYHGDALASASPANPAANQLVYESRRVRARAVLDPGPLTNALGSLIAKGQGMLKSGHDLSSLHESAGKEITNAIRDAVAPSYEKKPDIAQSIAYELLQTPGSFTVLSQICDVPAFMEVLLNELNRVNREQPVAHDVPYKLMEQMAAEIKDQNGNIAPGVIQLFCRLRKPVPEAAIVIDEKRLYCAPDPAPATQ